MQSADYSLTNISHRTGRFIVVEGGGPTRTAVSGHHSIDAAITALRGWQPPAQVEILDRSTGLAGSADDWQRQPPKPRTWTDIEIHPDDADGFTGTLVACRQAALGEKLDLAEPVTVSGSYQLAEPTADGFGWQRIGWVSGRIRAGALIRTVRALTPSEVDAYLRLDDEEAKAQYAASLLA